MTKYFLINLQQDDKRLFYENEKSEEDVFICEKCFRILKHNSENHLSLCDISFPEEDALYFNPKDNMRIYKLSNRDGKINERIIKIIERLSWFSKEEQKIDLRQITEKMFNPSDYTHTYEKEDKFYLYVLFSYKRIVGYLLFSERYTFDDNYNRIYTYLLSDMYIIREFRRKGLGRILFDNLINKEKINLNSLYFNTKVSEDIRKLLISRGIKKIKLLSRDKIDELLL